MIGERTLGSPLREICTMGSERGDKHKRPRSLGEGTGSKESATSEAPQWATVSRLVPTHQADLPPEQYAYRQGRNAQQAVIDVEKTLFYDHPEVVDADLADYFGSIPHSERMRSLSRDGSATLVCCI